jgi:hypothetical protein
MCTPCSTLGAYERHGEADQDSPGIVEGAVGAAHSVLQTLSRGRFGVEREVKGGEGPGDGLVASDSANACPLSS